MALSGPSTEAGRVSGVVRLSRTAESYGCEPSDYARPRQGLEVGGRPRGKLKAQKQIKALEAKRNTKRRQLFDAQDDVDKKRDALIGNIETQLQTKTAIASVFTLRWSLADGADATT